MIKMSSNSELTMLQAEWDARMHACVQASMSRQHSHTNRNMETRPATCIVDKRQSLLTQPKRVLSKECVQGNTKRSDVSTG